MSTTPERLRARRLHHRHGGEVRWAWITALGALPVLAVAIGAFVARPVADDYSIEATFQTAGSVGRAFSTWMHTWTATYSMYTLLTAGPRIERTIGTDVYYPVVSTLILILFIVAVSLVFGAWARATGRRMTRPARIACTAVLASLLLGSLTSFRHPTDPMLFGAFY